MPQRKDAQTESPRRSRAERPTPAWLQRLTRGLALAAGVAIFGGLGVGLIWGVPALEERLAERTRAKPLAVAFAWPPLASEAGTKPVAAAEPAPLSTTTWLPREVQDELMAVALHQMEAEGNPFGQAALRRVATALQETGWFERIHAVRRDRDAAGQPVVRVDADFRRPAAVVRHGDYDYLVSWSGFVMPLAGKRGWSDLKVITGVSQTPATKLKDMVAHGQPWPGTDFKAGLELLALVASKPWAAQVEAVDVSGYATGRQLALLTTRGGRIIWGGAPSEVIPGEVSTGVKLAKLDALAAQFQGRIDAGHRLVEIYGLYTLVDNSATAEASATPTRR